MSENQIPKHHLKGEWLLDGWGCWVLRQDNASVWIIKRPAYCDRGHFSANVEGIPGIDEADRFPRYYMNLERAKLEMAEWLAWRLHREACQGDEQRKHDYTSLRCWCGEANLVPQGGTKE